jgi:hypothetical protein
MPSIVPVEPRAAMGAQPARTAEPGHGLVTSEPATILADMRRASRSSAIAVSLVATGLVVACGGNVVVDPGAGTGNANASTSSSGGLGGSTVSLGVGASGLGGGTVMPGVTSGGGASCLNLPSTLTPCGANGATTGSGTTSCEFDYCQPNSSDTWAAVCQGSTCQCLLNGQSLCACASMPGDVCTNGSNGCCFH